MIPAGFSRYFWDVDVSTLNEKCDASFVIHRLFECGDLEAVHWLLNSYSAEQLKNGLIHCRVLSAKSAVFWSNLLNVPLQTLTCIRLQSTHKQETAWPY